MVEKQNKRLASSAAWVLLARVMAFVSVFGITAIAARAFEPPNFGLFALLFSLLGLTSLVATFGLNRALVKVFAERSKTNPAGMLAWSVRMVLAVSTGLAAICTILLGVLTSASWLMAITFGAIVCVRALQLLLAESCRGSHEKVWSNLFGGISGGPLPHLIVLVLICGLWSFDRLTLGSFLLVYALVVSITLWPLYKKSISLVANLDAVNFQQADSSQLPSASVVALAIPLMFTQVFGLALSQADIWIAGALVAPAVLGIYAAAQRMLAFLTVPLQISNTAMVSFIPELHSRGETEKLQRMISLAATISSVPALVIGGLFFAFAEPILSLAFGEFYAQSANLLRILTIGQVVCVLTGPSEVVLMMTGHQRITWRINLVAVIAIAGCGTLALVYGGLVGLAIVLCSATCIQNLTTWYLAKQLAGIATHCGASGIDLGQLIQLLKNRGRLAS